MKLAVGKKEWYWRILRMYKFFNCFMFSNNLTKTFSQIIYHHSLKYDDCKWILMVNAIFKYEIQVDFNIWGNFYWHFGYGLVRLEWAFDFPSVFFLSQMKGVNSKSKKPIGLKRKTSFTFILF